MPGTREISIDEVVRAGRVLFGPAFQLASGRWREALKATYRRRALETHPDRARALGRPELELAREFEAVADAYRVLSRLRAGAQPRPAARARPATAPPPPARPRAGASAERPGERASGRSRGEGGRGGPRVRVGVRPEDLPRRRLRLAEFLYYSGRVPWSDLVGAITWQRAQRPPLGRVAVELGFLAPADVVAILERRRDAGEHTTPFGECAVRLGYLTPFQLLVVLGRQLGRQRPIGQFFVERGVLDGAELEAVRRRILLHNARFRA